MRLPGGPPQGGTIGDTADRLPEVAPLTPEEEPQPEPTLMDQFRAGRVIMRSDRSTASRERMIRYYGPILDALGIPNTENPGNWQSETQPRPSRMSHGANAGFFGWPRINQEMAILGALRERRRADPNFLAGIPDDYEGFHAYMIEQEQAARARARDVIDRGNSVMGTISTFGGYIVEAATDPVNVASMPLGGGGRTLAQIAARSAIASAVVEAGQQPFIAGHRQELGETLTMGEASTNIVAAGVGGGVLGAGTAAVGRGAGRAYDFAIERVFNAMPEPVRERWAARMRIVAPDGSPNDISVRDFVNRLDDREAAEFARDVVGTDRLSPDERAAINVLERDAEIAEGSPFVRTPEGDTEHAGRLSASLRELMEGAATPATPRSSGLYGPLTIQRPGSGGAGIERRVMHNGKLRLYAIGQRTPVADGGAVVREIYPNATINSTRRARDPRSPNSWHSNSNAAVDVDPIEGMTFEQFVQGFRDRGHTIIEALDETGAGRTPHATGDHWHVVLGQPVSGGQAAPPTFERMWAAIIANEGGTDSRGRFLTSPDGAHGPAQVMPDTAPEAARLAGLPWDESRYRTDYDYNVALGQAYFRKQLQDFGNDPLKAAAAYNAGPGRLRQAIREHGDDWLAHMPAETRDYVANFQRRSGAGEGATGGSPIADAGDDAAARAAIERLYSDAASMEAATARIIDDPMDEAVAALRDAGEDMAPQLREDLDAMFEARREALTSQSIADDALPPYAADIIARAEPDQRADVEAFLREQWAKERPAREAEMRAMREQAEAETQQRSRAEPPVREGDAPPARVEVDERTLPPVPAIGRQGTGQGPVRASRALDADTRRMADNLGLPRLADFLAERLGTRQWVAAPRLTKALKAKGYERAVKPDELRGLQEEWAGSVWAAAAGDMAPAPVPDIRIRAEELKAFDDIDSVGIRQVADSLEHDLRIDVEALDGTFRLGEEGEEITARELLDSLNDDIDAATALRACL